MLPKDKKIESWSELGGIGEDIETEMENEIPVDSNVDRDNVSNNPINSNSKQDNKSDSEKERDTDMISAIEQVIDSALATKKEKEKPVFHGIYFEPEVSAAINKIAKKGGKGVKSKLINDIVKVALQQKGLL